MVATEKFINAFYSFLGNEKHQNSACECVNGVRFIIFFFSIISSHFFLINQNCNLISSFQKKKKKKKIILKKMKADKKISLIHALNLNQILDRIPIEVIFITI